MASVLCYISRWYTESLPKPSLDAHPATVYGEVGSNKKIQGDAMEMDANIAYGSHVSQNH